MLANQNNYNYYQDMNKEDFLFEKMADGDFDFYIKNKNEYNKNINKYMYFIIQSGNLELLKYIMNENNIKLNHLEIFESLGSHNLEFVKFCFDNMDNECKDNFDNGKLELTLNSPYIFSSLIKENNLDVIEYLVNKGIPLNKFMTSRAAEENNIDILLYLLNQGCEFNDFTLHYLLKNGNKYIAKTITRSYKNQYYILDYSGRQLLERIKNKK